jgi:hypothetical protein
MDYIAPQALTLGIIQHETMCHHYQPLLQAAPPQAVCATKTKKTCLKGRNNVKDNAITDPPSRFNFYSNITHQGSGGVGLPIDASNDINQIWARLSPRAPHT